jgi:hypothetical protein
MFSSWPSGRAILRETCPGDDKFRKTDDGLLVILELSFQEKYNYIINTFY